MLLHTTCCFSLEVANTTVHCRPSELPRHFWISNKSSKHFYLGLNRGKSGPALGGTDGVPADAISVPADSASEIVKFTISIPCESCTNAKAKYSSSVVPPDPSVHFYHWA